jgi:hypothetical protein
VDATFRLRRTYRNQGLGFLLGFSAWTVLHVSLALTDRDVLNRLAFASMAGIPLFMAGLSLWMLAACWREELAIRGDRVTFRGIFRRKAIGLNEVTRAEWRVLRDRVVLRNGSTRLAINLTNYEPEERERIILHLRSSLRPEVQDGWNLVAYKEEQHAARRARTKPGPDEVLIRRDRWDRYLGPLTAVAGLAGIAAWRFTGELRQLGFILLPLFLWVSLRATTPARGMIATKLSASIRPEAGRFIGFLLLWGLVGLAGLAINEYFRPRMAQPDAVLIVGTVVWLVVLFFEAFRVDRRQAASDREAADLAAKHRGESTADPWRAE